MKRVKHYKRSMSKYDMAYEIDRIHYCYMGLLLDSMTYEEVRRRLYYIVQRFCPYRMSEFENLTD